MHEKMYRLTRPDRYPPGAPGHTDPSARQGYYVKAGSPDDARDRLRSRPLTDRLEPGERLDVQAWDGSQAQGALLDDAGRPISRRFVQ